MPQPEGPIAVSAHDGRRRVVAGTNAEGQAAGVAVGMSLTQAQAQVPGLTVIEHDPGRDATALHAVALACLRYAPLVAVDPADGVWIDVTGCTELAGGEPDGVGAQVKADRLMCCGKGKRKSRQ